jgi:hypothetical protein
MKRLDRFSPYISKVFFGLLLIIVSSDIFCQSNPLITGATVNVRQIVQIKTQQPLSNNMESIPEHKRPLAHLAATKNVHYAREEKELKSLGQPSPAPMMSFASNYFAYDPSYRYVPPDPHGAVNENFVVGTVNDELYIQDRSGALIDYVNLYAFWSPLYRGRSLFDPRLVYDPAAGRWMLVTAANPASDSSILLVAVSQSANPTGSWNLYKIKSDAVGTRWADYPNIGFNKSWIAITVNLFGLNSDFSDTGRVYVFNRSDMENGNIPQMKIFAVDQGVYPAVTYDSGGASLFLLENYSEPAGQLQLLKITGDISSEKIISVGYPALSHTWSGEARHGDDFGPQLNDTAKLQCNDDRMASVLLKNNVIWGTHTVFFPADTDPTRSSVQWWAVDTNANVLQHGLIDDPTGNIFYAFPSIAVNKFNDALIGYSVFSHDQYASAGYSYHDHAQQPGSLNSTYLFVKGENTYDRRPGGRDRWGDCSATVIDPVNDIDFWTINEYALAIPNSWGTWWTQVAGLDTLSHDPLTTALGVTLAPNPNNGVCNFYLTGEINNPVEIDIYDLLGKRVYSKSSMVEISSIGISMLSHYLEEGIYIARVKVNGQTIDKKMLVHY